MVSLPIPAPVKQILPQILHKSVAAQALRLPNSSSFTVNCRKTRPNIREFGDRLNLHSVTHSQGDRVNQLSSLRPHNTRSQNLPVATPDNLTKTSCISGHLSSFNILEIFPTNNKIVSKTAPCLCFSQANPRQLRVRKNRPRNPAIIYLKHRQKQSIFHSNRSFAISDVRERITPSNISNRVNAAISCLQLFI